MAVFKAIIAFVVMSGFMVYTAASGVSAAELTEYQILKKADEARGNLKGVTWEVSVTDQEGNRTNFITYDVQARGFDIMATTLAPPKNKGDKVLMVSGNMWFHKPGLSKPFPISQRQKLIGNASYGDIAATNYAEDYEAVLLGSEKLGGEMCYIFDLVAKSKDTTYDRIKYWVSHDRLVGVRAEYFTLSGKRFKTSFMEYGNTVTSEGESRPFISKIGITDELMSNDVTTLVFDSPSVQPVPDYVFNLNLMVK